MLIICPECRISVSDKAIMCPHCGYPFKPDKILPRKSTRKKRLPNGFGQISFIKGNLRKPYRAMITVGKNGVGRPICKLLQPDAYFETYNEAYEALMKYHQNPTSVQVSPTMNELYEMWRERHINDVNNVQTFANYDSSWKYATDLHNKKVTDVKVKEIEQCLTSPNIPASRRNFLKIVLNQLFDFAIKYEYVDKNYARMYTLPKNLTKKTDEQSHNPFGHDELELIEKNITEIYARLIYIQCYTGFRPSELVSIEVKDVDLDLNIITGGMKTEAGKDRVVPIHSKIRPMIAGFMSLAQKKGSKYLFSNLSGGMIPYGYYYKGFSSFLSKIGLENHSPHDPRLTFITMAKEADVDEYAIKYMVGHKIQDITERVYTKRTIDWLKREIEKIK